MKKVLFTFVFALVAFAVNAQIKTCAYFDGYWSNWQDAYELSINGSYAGFIIYDNENGPWDPYFKFTIDDFYIPDSSTRKQYLRNNQWYEYTGMVEYMICDQYMTARDMFKSNKGPSFLTEKALKEVGRPGKKVRFQATIKIAPYKDHPKVYNIWYDNVGLGIDMNNIYFK